jgi:hypothetical protein
MLSTYRAHADECISIILSLRHNQEYTFPSELIQIIMKLYWNLRSTPVLVLFTLDKSYYCRKFSDIWYPSPLGQLPTEESILYKLIGMYSGLRLVNIYYSDKREFEHPELYPLRIRDHANWFPMILLIPGPLWDHAMLYPASDIELIDGVQIFNATSKNGVTDINRRFIVPNSKYDVTKVDDYVQWFAESLNNPEFIAAQNKLI